MTYTYVAHPKVLWDDGAPEILCEGIDAKFVGLRVAFRIDREDAFRVWQVTHDRQVGVEDERVVRRRRETMDEHFMSPYYEETNELGFANND